ncbi:MAG: hypothetical protein KGH65_02795 [Candidatus Micrarchaeota archaeon]|nr:hypothetical protein [Candidatus Micrarchaeota archaeon]
MSSGNGGFSEGPSKIIGFDPVKFRKAILDHPEIKNMEVGKSGTIPASGLVVVIKSGELYVCGTMLLSFSEEHARVTIKRVSGESDGFVLECSKMTDSDYKHIARVADLEEASEMFYGVETKDFLHIGSLRKLMTPLKRPEEDLSDAANTSTSLD